MLRSELAHAAIDYALHFPNYLRYSEHGHGQILAETRRAVQELADNDHLQFAREVGEYAIACADKVTENFEDDWEWKCSLERLVECVDKVRAEGKPG